MSAITLTIDGTLITAHEGQTLLEVAREHGVRIPTLCHLDGVSDVAACRLCLVEAQNGRLMAACVTPALEGMDIQTCTPRLQEYRKTIVELLFAEGNHVCSVCVANRHCELQDLAVEVGIDHIRFEYQHPRREVDCSHSQFGIDHNRCILCTRCVRVCDEIEGAHTWDVAGRGSSARIISDLAQPWGQARSCTSCGKCVQACPTGAIFRQGVSVAEMHKDRQRLSLLVRAREKKEWIV